MPLVVQSSSPESCTSRVSPVCTVCTFPLWLSCDNCRYTGVQTCFLCGWLWGPVTATAGMLMGRVCFSCCWLKGLSTAALVDGASTQLGCLQAATMTAVVVLVSRVCFLLSQGKTHFGGVLVLAAAAHWVR